MCPGTCNPAIVAKVGARSTMETGLVTTCDGIEAEGAGFQIRGSRIRASVWYGPLKSNP